jgi:glycosyltransferase involved in cell wall biosynthesis
MIGPYPPPDTGVSMPFKLFCDWLKTQRSEVYDVRVFRTHTDRKSLASFYHPQVLRRLLALVFVMPWEAVFADRIVIFSSNRFVTVVGGPMAVVMKLLRKPVSLRIFGGAFELYFQSRPRPIRWLIRRMFSCCDRIVAEPLLSAKALETIWPDRIRGVRNYRIPIPGTGPRTFDSRRVRFVFTGTVRGLKGIDELITAFADVRRRLASQRPDVRATLDIYGPLQEGSSDQVTALDAARQDADITFHGQVNNDALMRAYHVADVFVYPTYWPTEGHSGAMIEALFHGLPVVASDWRANPEVIQDGVNGLLCKHHDVANLADCMMRLALEVELRRRLSAGALASAGQYDVAVVCPELAEALGL